MNDKLEKSGDGKNIYFLYVVYNVEQKLCGDGNHHL